MGHMWARFLTDLAATLGIDWHAQEVELAGKLICPANPRVEACPAHLSRDRNTEGWRPLELDSGEECLLVYPASGPNGQDRLRLIATITDRSPEQQRRLEHTGTHTQFHPRRLGATLWVPIRIRSDRALRNSRGSPLGPDLPTACHQGEGRLA